MYFYFILFPSILCIPTRSARVSPATSDNLDPIDVYLPLNYSDTSIPCDLNTLSEICKSPVRISQYNVEELASDKLEIRRAIPTTVLDMNYVDGAARLIPFEEGRAFNVIEANDKTKYQRRIENAMDSCIYISFLSLKWLC